MIDARCVLDVRAWEAAGWTVRTVAVGEPQGRSRQLSTPPMCEAGLP